MLIQSHHLPLLSLVLAQARDQYREAFGPESPTGAMFAELAALVTRGGRIDLGETADARPKAKRKA